MVKTQVQSLGWEDLLEKEMATHSSIPAWRIPGTEEPGRLQSVGSQRVGRLSHFTSPHFTHSELSDGFLSLSLNVCVFSFPFSFLNWSGVAISSSRGSSQPRDQTCITWNTLKSVF